MTSPRTQRSCYDSLNIPAVASARPWQSQHTLRIATRRSALALAQTQLVVDQLRERTNIKYEIVPLTTKGDAQVDRSLAAIGGDGVFVKELFAALADGRADVAVHSLKDLPTSLPAELDAGAVPEREDASDVLISRDNAYSSIEALPPHAVVGTSSLRRAAQLRLRRPDLRIAPLRGNVDTRVLKVLEGGCAAAVVAFAGLRRAHLLGAVGGGSVLPHDVMVPAVGQGALFVQCRRDDEPVSRLVSTLDHAPSALATRMERAFLAAIGGGCVAPIGAHVAIAHGAWRLQAIVVATDGTKALRRTGGGSTSDAAEAIRAVEAVAYEMLAAGARELIVQARQRDIVSQ